MLKDLEACAKNPLSPELNEFSIMRYMLLICRYSIESSSLKMLIFQKNNINFYINQGSYSGYLYYRHFNLLIYQIVQPILS